MIHFLCYSKRKKIWCHYFFIACNRGLMELPQITCILLCIPQFLLQFIMKNVESFEEFLPEWYTKVSVSTVYEVLVMTFIMLLVPLQLLSLSFARLHALTNSLTVPHRAVRELRCVIITQQHTKQKAIFFKMQLIPYLYVNRYCFI